MTASESGPGGTPATTHAYSGDPEQGSDVWLAGVLARAVGEVPAVVALGQGHIGTAATHGPGKAVHGIALRHRVDGGLAVEVHVAVAQEDLGSRLASLRANPDTSDAASSTVLPVLAEEIRSHIARALQAVAVRAPASVDVYFDDVR